ncbi:MAG: PilZ domain-containing protein [Pseudomonadota bacterium]
MRRPKNNDDRRRVKRRELVLYLEVFDAENDILLGHLADINTGGIMLFGEDKIPLQEEYTLEIRLADSEAAIIYDNDGDRNIRFNAESRWAAPEPDSSLFFTGFKFMETSTAIRTSIRQIIRRLEVR